MIKSFMKMGVLSISAVMFTACGGGSTDSSGGDTPSATNKAPTANAGSDINVFGTNRVTLDASGSSDVDGSIVEYTWTEGATVLGKGEILNNLSFVDGEHTITLTVKDNAGSTATDTLIVTATCMNAESIELVNDVNGSLNYTNTDKSSSFCYELDLTVNSTTEYYTLYMNLYEGTIATRYYNSRGGDLLVELLDTDGHIKKFTQVRNLVGTNFYEQFEIPSEGKYYLRVTRKVGEINVNDEWVYLTAKYGFSVQPSIDNGLMQDEEGELNDFKSMATPVSLSEVQSDVNGTLNYSRVKDSSIKNTDQYDFYEIDFDKTGTFTFYMNLYEGTIASSYYNSRGGDLQIELHDAEDRLIKAFTQVRNLVGTKFNEQFTIPSEGKYYLKIRRNAGEYNTQNVWVYLAAKYGFSITQ